MEWDEIVCSKSMQDPPKKGPWAFKIAPGGSQNRGWDAPKCQDARKKRPRPAKKCPRAPKRQPRRAQERPRDAPEMPQRGRETVNLLKNRTAKARNASRTRSGALEENVAGLSSTKAFSEFSATKFRSVLSMIAKSATLDFYRPCRGFRRFFENARCSIHACARRDQNI